MAASDALYVVEDWISEHYFIADDKSGTFTARTRALMDTWRTTGEEDPQWRSPRERFTSSRNALVSRLIALQADAAALDLTATPVERRELLAEHSIASADALRTILGFQDEPAGGGEPVVERWDEQTYGPLRRFATRGVEEAPFAMLDALAAGDVEDVLAKSAGHLPADVILGEDTPEEQVLSTVPQVLSALAVARDAPEFMLVLAGRFAILTSSKLWPQGRYLVADVQTIAERNDQKRGGEVERMLAALSADSLAPDASSQIWWSETVTQSIDNAVGVSEDLRDGVRESIEILANEVVRRRDKQELDPLPQDQAQELALQSLRYLYRILFLLYAEASPELGVLPVGAPEYQAGYSVDRLRDLTQREVPLDAADGTYLYQSLDLLFRLINEGHGEAAQADDGEPAQHGSGSLVFENLEADLFRRDRTALLDEVQLGNKALQQVLENLLLSREKKGKARGFISYVALGINQLGAVYESLMSYTGSFAEQDLVEVARNGDPKGGSWVVPVDRVDDSMQAHLVMVEDEVGERVPRTYRHGEFVFRLSGRARQQSASYYSPEVITSFTVSQGLAELLDPVISEETALPDGAEVFDDEDFDHEPIRRRRTTAAEILEMSICEPALGSGAFAIEAVRQLAGEYLTRRQAETGKRIDPEQYAEELQRVKAYIALHNVYGVDLNPTAVELAEVSLWLDTMAPGLKAPWFGLRLRAGNSLIGARHSVYTAEALANARLKAVIESAPEALPLSTVHEEPAADGKRSSLSGKIFHFLLPGEGWLAAARDTEIKKLAPDAAKSLRDHAKGYASKLTKSQIAKLEVLSQRVEELWGLALRRIAEAEAQSRRAIPVWEAETREGGEVTREQIEASLDDANSAYRRLRLVMDAWSALWFWPVRPEDGIAPPTIAEWIETLEQILGRSLGVVKHGRGSKNPGERQLVMGTAANWYELDTIEVMFSVGGAADIESLLQRTPWLRRATEIAGEQRFFHWELDFAAAFDHGGFDLQVGNPPWVRPDRELSAAYGELDVWWALNVKPNGAQVEERRSHTVQIAGAREFALEYFAAMGGIASFLGSASQYPQLGNMRPNLYFSFIVTTWRGVRDGGIVSLIHPRAHFIDVKGGLFRSQVYPRLRRHWRFINELELFKDVQHQKIYSVNVYGGPRSVNYLSAVGLYHPSVLEGSLRHNGQGVEPGYRDAEGGWNLEPHRKRIIRVTERMLSIWHSLMEESSLEIPVIQTREVSAVNAASAEVLSTFVGRSTLGGAGFTFNQGWNETNGRRSGSFHVAWGPAESWQGTTLQGPYLFVNNPLRSDRNPTMAHQQDYSAVDLECIGPDRTLVTEYKPGSEGSTPPSSVEIDRDYGEWNLSSGDRVPAREYYRVFWRAMATTAGERTLIPAMYPPGTTNVISTFSMGNPEGLTRDLVLALASMGSLISDFYVRSFVGSAITSTAVRRLPRIESAHPLASEAMVRVLRLNCLTSAYSELWRASFESPFKSMRWTGAGGGQARRELGDISEVWTVDTPLRVAEDRRQAEVELDAIVALVCNVSIDDLVSLYRSQFGVLNKYDRGEDRLANIFDVNGRQIPSAVRTAWNKAALRR